MQWCFLLNLHNLRGNLPIQETKSTTPWQILIKNSTTNFIIYLLFSTTKIQTSHNTKKHRLMIVWIAGIDKTDSKPPFCGKIPGDRFSIVVESWMEPKNKNIKNSLGAKWNASHLAVRLCALRHWKRVSMPPTTQSLRHPLTRAIHFAPRIKTARRFTAKNPW